MRLLKKDQRIIGYKNYIDRVPVEVDGYETGEYEINYTDKKLLKCHVTPRSNTNTNVNGNTFPGYIGNRVKYEKIIITVEKNTGINENTLLFIDNDDTPDYKVTALSECKTHLAFVAEKIE